ncbi:MAG: multicopper oxidase family protein [Verrucomicrobiales bacterium]
MNKSFVFLLFLGLAPFLPFSKARACADCGKESFRSGRVVEYDLAIEEKTLELAGKPVPALTVNGSVPGPTLRFQEGDLARIRVRNGLRGEETSTHWHGLLLPNAQDGVPHVTTPPIRPGATHTFEFVLRHAGTYWYHSHTHLQEQRGVYGAIVVQPRAGTAVAASDRVDREEVLVLSDWTNESPNEVMRTLARGSEYYLLRRSTLPSILGAAQAGALGDYFSREWGRMPPMDVADVAYDAFLINGQRHWHVPGRPGERIRLRIVNAAASTYFYLHWSGGPLRIIEADGMPVVPVSVPRLLIGIAETYDVVLTVPPTGAWELRATAMDGSGHASAQLGDGSWHTATDPPKPQLYSMDEMLDLALADRSDNPRAAINLPRPGPPYAQLRARRDTSLPSAAPRRRITMRLTGDMARYTWSFDGKTMAEDGVVTLRHGEAIELELINDTMMHHPIHLHGHFFRVVSGQGKRAPLKHTVDVPPMGRRLIEFEANERHSWLFHCHILYHMMTGMGRVFRYEDPPVTTTPATTTPAASAHGDFEIKPHPPSLGEHAHEPWFAWGEAGLLSNFTEGLLTVRHGHHDFFADWEIGWENVPDTEYEIDVLYQRYFSPNFQAFAGARLTNEDQAHDRAVAGFNYRLPMRIQSTVSLDSEGDVRLALSHQLPLTDRLSAIGRVEYDTGSEWEWSAGAAVILNKAFSLTAQYHSEFGFGAGVIIRF